MGPSPRPGSMSRGICSKRSNQVPMTDRHGTYSPNGTRWVLVYEPAREPSGSQRTPRLYAERSSGPSTIPPTRTGAPMLAVACSMRSRVASSRIGSTAVAFSGQTSSEIVAPSACRRAARSTVAWTWLSVTCWWWATRSVPSPGTPPWTAPTTIAPSDGNRYGMTTATLAAARGTATTAVFIRIASRLTQTSANANPAKAVRKETPETPR